MATRLPRLVLAALFGASSLAACAAPPTLRAPHGKGAAIAVRVQLPAQATRQLMAPVQNWRQSDITRVELKLFVGATQVATKDMTPAELNNQGHAITFANLKANTTYRVEARAFNDPDAGGPQPETQISAAPAGGAWQTEVAVATDNAPAPASATVSLQLVDVTFDGTSTPAGIQVVAGGCKAVMQGVVSTVAGGGYDASDGAAGRDAQLPAVNAVLRASDGTIYVASKTDHVVRRIRPDRQVYAVAGEAGQAGAALGAKGSNYLFEPSGLAFAPDGDLLIADSGNQRIVRIDVQSADFTLGGQGSDPNYATLYAGLESGGEPSTGQADGNRLTAGFDYPTGLATIGTYLYVADRNNHAIRRIDMALSAPETDAGFVTTAAGQIGANQHLDAATGAAARFDGPFGIAASGNDLYVTEPGQAAIRKLTPNGTPGDWAVSTPVDASIVAGDPSDDTILAPTGVAVDGLGRIWFGDYIANGGARHYVRVFDATQAVADDRLVSWVKRTEGESSNYVDGLAADATFGTPSGDPLVALGLALDAAGNVYFADPAGGAVRKLQ